MRSRHLTCCAVALLWSAFNVGEGIGEEIQISDLRELIQIQAEQIANLESRIEAQEASLSGRVMLNNSEQCIDRQFQRVPLVTEQPVPDLCDETSPQRFQKLDYYVDYDRGFVIRPFNKDQNPFELKVTGWIQFRHHFFDTDVESWTDNAGVTRSQRDRNAFDIERARIVFSGYAVDERLTYFLQMDGDTDGSHAVDFFDYWWAWKFSDFLNVQLGKRKVPGSRQWLLGARRTRFVDRPMADDFFRPDRTVGVFGVGKIGEFGHYEAMIGNGYHTANQPNNLTDDQLTFAATNYFDPWGNFGGQLVDYDNSCDPLLRFGHSFVYSPQKGDDLGVPLGEADFVRLSDGTRLSQTGALAPGVTVSEFDIFLYSLDAAVKWRGFSLNSEVFLQWIESIRGDGALPMDSLFRHGMYVEAGFFLIPKKLDLNFRYSNVQGEFGGSSEYAAGVNWYPRDTHKLKVSFDVTSLDGSPLQNTTSDILVGNDGTLFRTQIQAEF